MDSRTSTATSSFRGLLVAFAWGAMLLVSDLPEIVLSHMAMPAPEWLFGGKIVFLMLLLGACTQITPLKPLFNFVFIMLVLFMALAASAWLRDAAWWRALFAEAQPTFFIAYLEPFIRDIGVALAVVAGLWMIFRRRQDFFLVRGRTDAPIEPVRWLGIGAGESWKTFGWIFAGIVGAIVLVMLMVDRRPSPELLVRVLPLLPAVFLFSAVNALTEEIYFRASMVSTLVGVIGRAQTLLISSVFFGLAHYLYGSPPGMVGFAMTAFLAWMMGKSLLETRGIGWAWFIHFVADLPIFFTYALLWLRG
jgi:membrane protease YdiL (CAAX protease family)